MKHVPDNIETGWYHNEEYMMNTKLTLCFLSDGKTYLEYDESLPRYHDVILKNEKLKKFFEKWA